MTGVKLHMQKLHEARTRALGEVQDLERKLEHARVKLATIEEILGDEISLTDPTGPGRRKNTKRTVMEIITEAGKVGVTPTEVVEKAVAKGRKLKSSSVSSLLSKLKAAGTLKFDGERYYPAGMERDDDDPFSPPLRIVSGA